VCSIHEIEIELMSRKNLICRFAGIVIDCVIEFNMHRHADKTGICGVGNKKVTSKYDHRHY